MLRLDFVAVIRPHILRAIHLAILTLDRGISHSRNNNVQQLTLRRTIPRKIILNVNKSVVLIRNLSLTSVMYTSLSIGRFHTMRYFARRRMHTVGNAKIHDNFPISIFDARSLRRRQILRQRIIFFSTSHFGDATWIRGSETITYCILCTVLLKTTAASYLYNSIIQGVADRPKADVWYYYIILTW